MKATCRFGLYELRRHVPTLAVGSAFLVIFPLTHRLVEGQWNYWGGEWKLAGAAVAAFGIAPLMMVLMAVSGWEVQDAD